SGGFLAWDIAQFRSEAKQDTRAQSAILAENSGAPLTFGDDRVAREILQTLAVRPRVQMACLYESTGTVLTSYQRDPRGVCPGRPAQGRVPRHAVARAPHPADGDARLDPHASLVAPRPGDAGTGAGDHRAQRPCAGQPR